jgi:hypothetical protein
MISSASYSHGHVSNDPIFPTDESMKLYGALMVLLKNSKVARGHPPTCDKDDYLSLSLSLWVLPFDRAMAINSSSGRTANVVFIVVTNEMTDAI